MHTSAPLFSYDPGSSQSNLGLFWLAGHVSFTPVFLLPLCYYQVSTHTYQLCVQMLKRYFKYLFPHKRQTRPKTLSFLEIGGEIFLLLCLNYYTHQQKQLIIKTVLSNLLSLYICVVNQMLNKTYKDIRRIVIHFSFSEKLECIKLNLLGNNK